MTTDKHAVLRQYFGHSAFRGGQEELIDAVLAGRDVLGIMPTGGGKSVCYQVPALMLPGLSLVISPLISLMKDQVAALEAAGIPAAFVNSSMTGGEFQAVCAGIRAGAYRLLYVAPERLDNEGFLSLISRRQVPLVAVDEAHCVSQWGQDFRPSYLRIAGFVAALPRRPVVAAFTATATEGVREDIVRGLDLRDPLRVVTGFDRPNLRFAVHRPKKKLPLLLALLEERREKSGIVYCATRAKVEQVCEALCQNGFSAARYHAGLPDQERKQNQEDFQYDRRLVMVATNAFGMGIDKSNVGYVIHYNMPKDLESYYQEAGRAGRDGEPTDCILLFNPGDIYTAKFLIGRNDPEEEASPEQQERQQRDLDRLDVMIGYCKTKDCLRGYILRYFGQPYRERCGNCSNCCLPRREEDITVPAQMILSCVLRVQRKLGYYVGANLIQQVLRGSRGQRVSGLGLDRLSTYGLMRDKDRRLIQDYIDCLKEKGYLYLEPAHETLRPTPQADEVLFRGETVTMLVQAASHPEVDRKAAGGRRSRSGDRPERRSAREGRDVGGAAPTASVPPMPSPREDSLLAALRQKRTQLAQEAQVPAYVVFSNATLVDMADRAPANIEEFMEVSGVGAVKAARYGRDFLEVIARYRDRQRRG